MATYFSPLLSICPSLSRHSPSISFQREPRLFTESVNSFFFNREDKNCSSRDSPGIRSKKSLLFSNGLPRREVKVKAGNWWKDFEGGKKGRGRGGGSEFGKYPWEEEDEDDLSQGRRVEWIQEDVITLITDNGVVKLGGSRVPRVVQAGGKVRGGTPVRRFREEDFMDPQQKLCLGALFDIAATNGLDMGRRFCILGFCRSVEMLSAVVEDTVREQGGEVVVLEKQTMEGLHEKLHLTVAIPLLWGVPPAVDALNQAIRSGGGIVDKVYRQWEFF